jgi:integrase
VVEHLLHTQGVAGSNPAPRTIFTCEIGHKQIICTEFAQINARTPDRRVRFPVTIRHRTSKAKIYAPRGKFAYYRLAYTTAGKRRMQTFANYSAAKKAAKRKVREMSNGSQAAALNATQSRDALAAFERLQEFFQASGRRVSLLAAVSDFAEASGKLDGRTMGEAVTGYLGTVASVKRKNISVAVEEFIQINELRTRAVNGQRAQLSAKYFYNLSIQLRRFAATFPNTVLCDLTKQHLDAFIKSLDAVKTKSGKPRAASSAKSRNHYRTTVRQFLQWAVRKDYLPVTHRLNEADAMRPERANTADVEFYTPEEFAALLKTANETWRPIIAIGGLAGLRTAELLRLDWSDVWRVPGHIEITAGKAKTRQRRLVEICPALRAWLEPYRAQKTGKFWPGEETTFQDHFGELCETAEITRKTNGLRHSFCSFHFALHANENQTAQQAGNSPTMIHAHYKGLATKAEAKKWFGVLPPKSAKNIIQLTAATARTQAVE